jgi:Ca-activated chloride channel family protein
MAQDPNRYYTVVVMTDGETRDGADFAKFKMWFDAQPQAVRKVKAFPVLFGEGSESELKQVAQMTGGKYFDSRTVSLPLMFKEIRGYQ